LKVGGEVGWTGDDTPIYERFYAGGFQSLRGFEFRGVSPRQFDVRLGGRYLVLGTVEYQIPLTANDNVAAVVFSDAGTVENDADFDNFRVSVGAGLRLIIPAMGPVPLAFDFAVPLARADFDDTQVFSFYIGVNY
jgi:outer membrane protein insertion porin family